VADDQEQRTLEVIKLRIAFLQHITTLSGAAILIVLALIQRAETAEVAKGLATALPFFALAALFSLFGVWSLIHRLEVQQHVPASAGKLATINSTSLFSSAVLVAAVSAARVADRVLSPIAFIVLPLELVAFVVVFLLLKRDLICSVFRLLKRKRIRVAFRLLWRNLIRRPDLPTRTWPREED
jgi:hypothetical protein